MEYEVKPGILFRYLAYVRLCESRPVLNTLTIQQFTSR